MQSINSANAPFKYLPKVFCVMCTQAIDILIKLIPWKQAKANQAKGIQSHQTYIDSRQIGFYIYLGHDQGMQLKA